MPRQLAFGVIALLAAVAPPLPVAAGAVEPTRSLFPAGWRQGWVRSVEGRKLSYRWGYPGFAVSLLCRAVAPDWAIAWEGEPAPTAPPDAAVTYVWHVGLNSGKSPHRFELQLDGRPVVTFDTAGGTENRSWTVDGHEGARLQFLTTRLGGFDERFGFMALSLPRRALGDGPPRFRLVPEAAGSQDYVLVFEEPLRAWAGVVAEEAVLKGGRRLLTAELSHLGPPAPFVASAEGREIARGTLDPGHNRIALSLPEGVGGSVRVRVESAGATLLDGSVPLLPVAPRVFHLVPHSHVDIGYSDPQPEVERKQWKNLTGAIALSRKTRDLKAEARFHWEAEGLWAVESYLAQASDGERRELLDAVRDGELELPANLTNVLTGLCHPEELARWTDAARRLKRRYGIDTSPVAMHSDIPGLAWPTLTALAQAGVRYLSSGPNYMPNLVPDGGDRIGSTLQELGDRPFWWISPSGRERLLVWVAGRGYSWFHGGSLGRDSDAAARGLFDYARDLAGRAYPYEMVQVRYTVGGDNGPVDPNLPDWVARWNETYDTPRLAISAPQALFEALEKRYGAVLPERRGDMTPYWEDGALSSAAEEALARAAARRLLQAEALWALADPAAFPRDRAEEAWRRLLLWHEHTWGAADSISQPDRPDVVAQWEYKRAFAVEADRGSQALLDEATRRLATASEAGQRPAAGRAGLDVVVVNTLGVPRSGLVVLPPDRSRAGDRALDAEGRRLASQRLAGGSLAVWLRGVGTLASTTIRVASGRPAAPETPVTASLARLESRDLRVELDPRTGAIRSLLDRGVERAGPDGLARYRYVPGLDPGLAQDAGPVSISVEEAGPLVAVLRIDGQAPGARAFVMRYRLVAGSESLEIELLLDKLAVRTKESGHLTFDLAVDGGQRRVDQGWNLIDPATQVLPGSCRDFVGAHGALDVAGPAGGVQLGVIDSPLIELGRLVDERPNVAGIRRWSTEPAGGTTVHAYLFNNYWHTNYKAEQAGPLRFRFVLRPHGPEAAGALTAFSRELEQPLLVLPPASTPALHRLRLEVDPDVHVVGLRPSGEGATRLVRLLNAGERPRTARVDGGAPVDLQPWEVRELRAQ